MINSALSGVSHWLYPNMIVFSEAQTISLKSLFSHTFLCDPSLVFVLKG